MHIFKLVVRVLDFQAPASVFMHLIQEQIFPALCMESLDEVQKTMRAEIDIIQTGVQYICCIRGPKLLHNAL